MSRIVLNMEPSQAEALKAFSKNENQATVAETMRKAYELLKLVKSSEKNGYEMIIRKKDDHNKEKLVIL